VVSTRESVHREMQGKEDGAEDEETSHEQIRRGGAAGIYNRQRLVELLWPTPPSQPLGLGL
jgi:hypothetical protein